METTTFPPLTTKRAGSCSFQCQGKLGSGLSNVVDKRCVCLFRPKATGRIRSAACYWWCERPEKEKEGSGSYTLFGLLLFTQIASRRPK